MKIIIIGAGPAGVSAAETIRAHDQQSEILMFSSEPFPPYSPPAMADHFIHESKAHLWRGQDWPEKQGLDYKSGSAFIEVEAKNHLV